MIRPRTALQLAHDRTHDRLRAELAITRQNPRRAKFGNIVTIVDGRKFDSKREAAEYLALRAREALGEISHLECQPVYQLVVNGVRIGSYRPDFQYLDLKQNRKIVVDVKSPATAEDKFFRRTRKLFEAIYGIELQVVT